MQHSFHGSKTTFFIFSSFLWDQTLTFGECGIKIGSEYDSGGLISRASNQPKKAQGTSRSHSVTGGSGSYAWHFGGLLLLSGCLVVTWEIWDQTLNLKILLHNLCQSHVDASIAFLAHFSLWPSKFYVFYCDIKVGSLSFLG